MAATSMYVECVGGPMDGGQLHVDVFNRDGIACMAFEPRTHTYSSDFKWQVNRWVNDPAGCKKCRCKLNETASLAVFVRGSII